MCMSKTAPQLLRCVEKCGCGPKAEQKEAWADITAAAAGEEEAQAPAGEQQL